METDYRKNKKVLVTLELEDKGQDFLELDILEDGVMLGDSVMFRNGKLSLLGVGALDGIPFYTWQQVAYIREKVLMLNGLYVYFKQTENKKDPLPWNAPTLKYKVVGAKKAVKINRFIEKKNAKRKPKTGSEN